MGNYMLFKNPLTNYHLNWYEYQVYIEARLLVSLGWVEWLLLYEIFIKYSAKW